MRRIFALMTCVLLVLAACGDDDTGEDAVDSVEDDASAESPDDDQAGDDQNNDDQTGDDSDGDPAAAVPTSEEICATSWE